MDDHHLPLVSVLVPTYQHKDYIAACLDGILMQRTTFPFEVLVGEDGSDDGTGAICARFEQQFPGKVKVFTRSRRDVVYIRGQATGRGNLLGLMKDARGRYIALCEGDDVWIDENKLQRQFEALEQEPTLSAAYHNTRVIDNSGNKVADVWRTNMKESYELNDVVSESAVFHTSSFMVRNYEVFKAMPALFTRVSVADLVLFSIAASNGTMVKVAGILSAYRKHTGGITNTDLYTGTRFHIERMRLWMFLDRYFAGRIRDETSRVCGWHWNKIMEHTSGRQRLSALWDLFTDVPMWFIVRPRTSMYLLRSVLPR